MFFRQTIQYLHPSDAHKLGQAELVVIDEAAAIPLPLVKGLLGPYLVFMASTINGYEGTGRSLSLKLLDQLRQQSNPTGLKAQKGKDGDAAKANVSSSRSLREVALEESIRYKPNDEVEKWLNNLLCLVGFFQILKHYKNPPLFSLFILFSRMQQSFLSLVRELRQERIVTCTTSIGILYFATTKPPRLSYKESWLFSWPLITKIPLMTCNY